MGGVRPLVYCMQVKKPKRVTVKRQNKYPKIMGIVRRPSKQRESGSASGGPNLPAPQAQSAPVQAPSVPAGAPSPSSELPASLLPSPAPVATTTVSADGLLPDIGNPDAQPRSIVVHLHSATNLPRLVQLNRTSLSPYVTMCVMSSDAKPIGQPVVWSPRPQSTRAPVWNWAQDLRVPSMSYCELEKTKLHLEIWDDDGPLLPPNLIGKADVPLLSLISDAHVAIPLVLSPLASAETAAETLTPPQTPPLTTATHAGPTSPRRTAASTTGTDEEMPSPLLRAIKRSIHAVADPWDASLDASEPRLSRPPSILLKLVRAFPRRKRLYIVRHAESEWNKAQSGLDLGAMYAQVDHPLSATGRIQAESLARALADANSGVGGGGSDDENAASLREACACELVMSSPFTRALQTCLIGFGSVLRAKGQAVYLAPNARERLNPGSADSFGCAVCASEVLDRTISKTRDLFDGDDSAAREVVGGIALDDTEVQSKWWSTVPEGKEGVSQRMAALVRQIQYSSAEVILLVGHSHFLRELMKEQLRDNFVSKEPALAAQLKKCKLSNCGIARLDLEFDDDVAIGKKVIADVRLLAGTKLVT